MNKTLILQYKVEFDCWLNGGKLLYKNKDLDVWFGIGEAVWGLSTSDVRTIIINDEYVEFRKALAEVKTVEFKHPQVNFNDWEIVTSDHIFQSVIPGREYRIRPLEKCDYTNTIIKT